MTGRQENRQAKGQTRRKPYWKQATQAGVAYRQREGNRQAEGEKDRQMERQTNRQISKWGDVQTERD